MCLLIFDISIEHIFYLSQSFERDNFRSNKYGVSYGYREFAVSGQTDFQSIIFRTVTEQCHSLVVLVGIHHHVESERLATKVAW